MPQSSSSPVPSAVPDPAAAQLWQADEALHALLMARAERLAGSAAPPPAFSPGREAALLRHLLARHRGPMAPRALVQIWREVFAATAPGGRTIALCETEADNRQASAARAYFGALTTLHAHRSAAQALDEVRAGTALAAVLPLPSEGEPAPWWAALAYSPDSRLHVVARLPFWRQRTESPLPVEMLVVAAMAPEASGADRSLLAFESPPEQSRARLLAALLAAGFVDPRPLVFRRDASLAATQALVDVEGFVAAADPRLAAVADTLRPACVLGAYAVPLEEMSR